MLGSLKVIVTNTDKSTAYDFLLTFHNNHGSISGTVSEINGDFSRKSQIFQPPCILRPPEGVPLGIAYRRMGLKTRVMELRGRRRSLMTS